MLAQRLVESDPQRVVGILDRLEYYGRIAAATGVPGAQDTISYDSGVIVVEATRGGPKDVTPLIDAFLRIRKCTDGVQGLSIGMIKARILVAAELERTGRIEASERVASSLAGVGAEALEEARRELVAHENESFWEVTDRQINIDWVRPELRPFVEGVVAAAKK
jgi:hypothetical protein